VLVASLALRASQPPTRCLDAHDGRHDGVRRGGGVCYRSSLHSARFSQVFIRALTCCVNCFLEWAFLEWVLSGMGTGSIHSLPRPSHLETPGLCSGALTLAARSENLVASPRRGEMSIARGCPTLPPAQFGGAELNLAGTHLLSFRPSELGRDFIGSRSINISLLRSEEPPNKRVAAKNLLQTWLTFA
jgi:hypothetical protein